MFMVLLVVWLLTETLERPDYVYGLVGCMVVD